MGKRKKKEIEFHPVVGLLNAANREFAPVIMIAKRMGIRFEDFQTQDGTFTSTAPMMEEDTRHVRLRVELVGSDEMILVIGLTFPSVGRWLSLTKYPCDYEWTLERSESFEQFAQDVSAKRMLRALGLEQEQKREIPKAKLLEVVTIMLKDYQKSVLIPRRARAEVGGKK